MRLVRFYDEYAAWQSLHSRIIYSKLGHKCEVYGYGSEQLRLAS